MIVDFSGCRPLNHEDIDLLLECVAQVAGRDTQVLFVAGSRANRVLLEVTRISSLVPVFNSVEEALLIRRWQQTRCARSTEDPIESLKIREPISNTLECVNESDRSAVFKMLLRSPCWSGAFLIFERNAAFGQSSAVLSRPANPALPARSRTIPCRMRRNRKAASQTAQTQLASSPHPRPQELRSEGRQCERSSRGPARGRSGGACPSARSSLAADQAGCDGGSRNSRGCSRRFVGEKSIAAARGFARYLSFIHETTGVLSRWLPIKPMLDRRTDCIPRPFLISFLGNRRSGEDHANRVPFGVSEGAGPARVTA